MESNQTRHIFNKPKHRFSCAPFRKTRSFLKVVIKVQEVVGIMRGNVEKVLERDQKLSQLDDRADALQQGAR